MQQLLKFSYPGVMHTSANQTLFLHCKFETFQRKIIAVVIKYCLHSFHLGGFQQNSLSWFVSLPLTKQSDPAL